MPSMTYFIQKRQNYLLEFLLIALAFFSLFVKIIPVVYFAAFTIILAIIRCNLSENIVGLIVFYPVASGLVFNTLGIPMIGGLMKYVGFFLLLLLLLSGKIKINSIGNGLIPLVVLLLLFTLSVVTTSGGDFAGEKLSSTIIHGTMVFFAFAFMFSNPDRFDFSKMGMFFLVIAVFLVPMSIVTNGISGPSGITDFGFLRYQTQEDYVNSDNNESILVSYQGTGFLLLQALGFFLVDSKKNRLPLIILVFAIVFFAQLYVGSRQALVSIIIMAIVWALIVNRRTVSRSIGSNLKWFLAFVVVMIVSFLYLSILTADEGLLNSVAEEGYLEGGGRGAWLLSGMDQFMSRPLWGVGYGRFIIFGQYGSYPHNLFVELLCETGIVGFFIAMTLTIKSLVNVKKAVIPFITLFLAYFLRSMASGSLAINIMVFSLLFASSSLFIAKKRIQI